MAHPKQVARFRRLAFQRREAAEVLLKQGYTTDAVYLAGYTVECILKALALSLWPQRQHAEMVASFRGRAAHDYEWIRRKYLMRVSIPKAVLTSLVLVGSWTPDIRYDTSRIDPRVADRFFADVKTVLDWCEGRIG